MIGYPGGKSARRPADFVAWGGKVGLATLLAVAAFLAFGKDPGIQLVANASLPGLRGERTTPPYDPVVLAVRNLLPEPVVVRVGTAGEPVHTFGLTAGAEVQRIHAVFPRRAFPQVFAYQPGQIAIWARDLSGYSRHCTLQDYFPSTRVPITVSIDGPPGECDSTTRNFR